VIACCGYDFLIRFSTELFVFLPLGFLTISAAIPHNSEWFTASASEKVDPIFFSLAAVIAFVAIIHF
jgi:hypothetical protein